MRDDRPEDRDGHEVAGDDDFAARTRRFVRGRFAVRRFACPECGAHAMGPGLCLVCCAATTEPLRDAGRSVERMAGESPRLEELRAQARYHRQRYDLYRARAYGMRPVDPNRLRELEHAALAAEARLAHALSSR